MSESHVVWDWNGTLLDDLPIVIEAVNRSIAIFEEGPIDADGYRDHYTRPVRLFYESLFGRVLHEEEWLRLNTSFHDHYLTLAEKVDLVAGARSAMDLLANSGWSQSLLSMSPQDWLASTVDRLELTDRFDLVDGLSEVTGGLKAAHLESHLDTLGLSGPQVVVIGDTPDDVDAARHVGARAILFHGGSHHLDALQAQGVPIADSILGAAEIALSLSRR